MPDLDAYQPPIQRKPGEMAQLADAEYRLILTPEQMHRLRLITMHYPDSDVTLAEIEPAEPGAPSALAVEISDQYGDQAFARAVIRPDGQGQGSRVDGRPIAGWEGI